MADGDEGAWPTRDRRQAAPRRRRVAGMAPALVTLIAGGGLAVAAAPPAQPTVDLPAIAALGSLAFRWHGELWVAGPSGLHDIGPGVDPVWSPSGRFLASLAGSGVPGGGPLPLRLHRADGEPVPLPDLRTYPGAYAWLPGTEALAVAVARPAGIDLVDASSARVRRLAAAPGADLTPRLVTGPGVVVASVLTRGSQGFSGRLEALRLDGSHRLLATRREAALLTAGVVAGRALAWLDPQASSSIAADGMALFAVPLAGGPPRRLTLSLGEPAWVVPGPPGHVLVVAGAGRWVWSQKRLVDCTLATGRCAGIELGRADVPSDPAYDPATGRLAFVLAPNRGPAGGFATAAEALRWVGAHVLAVAGADGRGLSVYPATAGAYAPAWAARGRTVVYLGLRDIDALDPATGRRIRLVSGLAFRLDDLLGFYGRRPSAGPRTRFGRPPLEGGEACAPLSRPAAAGVATARSRAWAPPWLPLGAPPRSSSRGRAAWPRATPRVTDRRPPRAHVFERQGSP
jgi:hypothetical protein